MAAGRRPVAVVDLGGVLAPAGTGNPFVIRPAYPGAAAFTHLLGKRFRIVIQTKRVTNCGDLPRLIRIMEHWLKVNKIKYDEIWTKMGKPLADVFIDDKAVRCFPEKPGLGYKQALLAVKEMTGE